MKENFDCLASAIAQETPLLVDAMPAGDAVMVEHVMDAIRSLCDRCVVMSSGAKIAEGTTDDVLSDQDVIRAYLGDDDA